MTPIRFLTIGAVAGVLMLGSSACSNDAATAPDNTGPVTVSLTTPSADDGALLLIVTGPGLSAVLPASSAYQVYWRLANATETRVIVVGDIVAGPIFTATAPAGVAASQFAASVTEVSTRADALRPSAAGYSLSATR
jgi:hypothetical protein